jgi:hypothetical protein
LSRDWGQHRRRLFRYGRSRTVRAGIAEAGQSARDNGAAGAADISRRDGLAEDASGSSGKGKRGGLRAIYYFKKQDNEIWMLTIYGKSQVENIPAHILGQIAEEVKNA